jgi:hypothetical protein
VAITAGALRSESAASLLDDGQAGSNQSQGKVSRQTIRNRCIPSSTAARYNCAHGWRSLLAQPSDRMKSLPCSVQVAWERFTVPGTHAWIVPWRSKFLPPMAADLSRGNWLFLGGSFDDLRFCLLLLFRYGDREMLQCVG